MAATKLTPEQKAEVKALYNKDSQGNDLKSLATRFGVSVALIYRIVSSKRYARYRGRRANTGSCLFCGKPLEGMAVHAKTCSGACKTNLRRLGPGGKIRQPTSKTMWMSMRFGELRLVDDGTLPEAWHKSSHIEVLAQCSCGRTLRRSWRGLSNGYHRSCGRCSEISKECWLSMEFGKLKIVSSTSLPPSWPPQSNISVPCICSCGKQTSVFVFNLSSGKSTSCGCGYGLHSKESKDFYEDLRSIFPDAQYSVRGILTATRFEFDVWVPSKRLAIEYHGLYWHSEKAGADETKTRRDHKKYLECKRNGIRLVQVYADDWKTRRPVFEDLLCRLANPKHGGRVYGLTPVEITTQEAQEFLDRNHYLSGSQISGSLCVGLRDPKGGLYAASVFKWQGKCRKNSIEWTRHAFKIGYRTWEPAKKCLDFAISRLKPDTVVTFSDNRLHTGGMYKALGFSNDGEVGVSYQYSNGVERKHKFAFRVPAGMNEEAEAAAKGWFRLYDSGKTRWVLDIQRPTISV